MAPSIAFLGMQLTVSDSAHATDKTFPGVRKGIYRDRSGQNQHYVEFEPNMYATTWNIRGPLPALQPFWGDVNRRAYRILRAFYFFPLDAPDSLPPNIWELTGTDISPVIPGDLNGDGKVDALDYDIYLANVDKTGCSNTADINGDCMINTNDYNIIHNNYGKTFEVQRWES